MLQLTNIFLLSFAVVYFVKPNSSKRIKINEPKNIILSNNSIKF